MVVLDSNGVLVPQGSQNGPQQQQQQPRSMQNMPYHHLQYVQPLPSDYDEKCDPLAMLTRACNKIETDLMKSHGEHKITSSSSNRSTKMSLESPRSSTTSDRPDSSSPLRNQPIASTSPIDYKIRPPSEQHQQQQNSSRTPKRPHSSSSSTSSASPPAKHFIPTSSSATPPATSHTRASPRLPQHSMPSPLGMSMPNPAGVCVDPMCRDPTCPTTAARNAHFLNFFAGARVNPYFYPPSTTAAMLGLSSPPSMPQQSSPMTTTSLSSSSSAPSTTSTSSIGGSSPFVCNWMSGSDFCGRRFSSSDDLMSHLRSHTTVASSAPSPSTSTQSPTTTSSMPSPVDTLAALQAAQLQAMYPTLGSQSALAALQARAVSAATSSLSPNSAAAARYHPYMRPGGMGLPPPGFPPGFQFGQFPPHMSPFGAASPFLPYGLPPFPYS